MARAASSCPLIGLVLLFAALGPAVGGALFFPLAVILKPPIGADTLALSALVAALFGHTIALIASYVVGVGPAAATGFLYGLWDAAVPDRWPRALAGRDHRRRGRLWRAAAARRDRAVPPT